jgi:hypothetical protein
VYSYLHTKFAFSCSGSLVISIKQKAKYKFCVPKQMFVFFEVLLTYKIMQHPALNVVSYLLTSEVCTAGSFDLLVAGN